MHDATGNLSATLSCWAMGAIAGLLAAVMVFVLGDLGWSASAFVGVVLAVVVGGLTGLIFTAPLTPLHASRPAAAQIAPQPVPVAEVAMPAPVAEPVADPVAAPVETVAPEAAPAPVDDSPVAADGKPAMLAAPRGGKADDLKQIKGVGPKLEGMLHGMGIYHFDQIAGWRARELAWVDDNLEGFKGRASRDNWVDQAKVLAAGGETAFSRKVEEGDVY